MPTIATPCDVRSNADVAAIPSTTTTSAPGTFGANFASPNRIARLAKPTITVAPFQSSMLVRTSQNFSHRVPRGLGRADDLVELTDRDVEAETDDEAVEDGLGEEAGDEAHPKQSEDDVEDPDQDRERRRERDVVSVVPVAASGATVAAESEATVELGPTKSLFDVPNIA